MTVMIKRAIIELQKPKMYDAFGMPNYDVDYERIVRTVLTVCKENPSKAMLDAGWFVAGEWVKPEKCLFTAFSEIFDEMIDAALGEEP